MAQYRVSFFNNLVNSNGMRFKCRQREVIVDNATDAAAASDKATREFARLEGVPKLEVPRSILRGGRDCRANPVPASTPPAASQ